MKKVIGLVLVAGLLAVGFFVFRGSGPVRVAANVVFNEAGKYRSPSGNCYVDVFETDEGKLKYTVYRQTKEARDSMSPTEAFSGDSNWFMCWDLQDKLWTYIPEQNLENCRNHYFNKKAVGSTVVGEFGGWEGIPDAFFERLPEVAKDKYELYKQKKTPPVE